MNRTLSLLAGFAAVLLLAAGLLPVPAQAKCKKDCLQTINKNFRTCKSACPKHKAGKTCRAGCSSQLKNDQKTCRKATNPTPPTCGASTPTTTTTLGGNRSTMVVLGALPATLGRFNFNLTLGLPGANAACGTSFAGSHVCTLQELQGAPASDLAGLRDTTAKPVTSFWAIDSSANPLQQCQDDVNSFNNWEYATAHTSSRGEQIALDNASGHLGALTMGAQCNVAGTSWVACCH